MDKGGKSKVASSKALRELAKGYTQDSLNTLVELMSDAAINSDVRLRAAALLLEHGHGKPADYNPLAEIVRRFAAGEISALTAGLSIESHGLKIPPLIRQYVDQELTLLTQERPIFVFPWEPELCALPRQ